MTEPAHEGPQDDSPPGGMQPGDTPGQQHRDSAEQSRQADARDLRVSDAEREHVVGILEKAIGRGVLGLDEFTTRTDTALAARTRRELNIVLADLPGLTHPGASTTRQLPTT